MRDRDNWEPMTLNRSTASIGSAVECASLRDRVRPRFFRGALPIQLRAA